MMNKYLISSLLLTSTVLMSHTSQAQLLNYPDSRKTEQKDTYFGTEVADPYRWLEDDRSEETAAWVKEQIQMTDDYLKAIPFRDKLKERLTKIWNFPKWGVPFKKGAFYFFSKNDGIQNQNIIYMQKGLDGRATVILDPNKLATDGTVALTDFKVSKDGHFAAYSIAKAGSDWEDINVMDLNSKNPLTDKLNWIKFSGIAWKDSGFYYSRYAELAKGAELTTKNEYHKVYYHKLGQAQEKDVLVYEDKNNPLRNFSAQVTDDERFLIIYETQATSGNAFYVKDLSKRDAQFKKITDGFEYEYNVVDNIGPSLVVQTNKNAPRYKIIIVNTDRPDEKSWRELVPQQEEVLQGVAFCGDKLALKYMKDATSRLYLYSTAGVKDSEIKLPGIGTVDEINGDKDNNNLLYAFTTFTAPTTIYKNDVVTKKNDILYNAKIDFKTEDYETEQVFYVSKDGTKVPMFIVHKKGLVLDGTNPTLLFGYGGFNISKTPEFKIERLVFLEQGGVFAMANLRGGGEYGEDWHKAGTKLQKQNVFDDFIAAAQYLIDQKYTSPDNLAINGRSNGGLLVGACMTQRPDLFKVAIPTVGVLDMLRFHKFTIGWAWVGDYGSSDDSTQFKALYAYSPLHNVKEGVNYPATLITTGDHDDRVVPAHSFKYAATLQAKYKGDNPMLIRIDSNAGHGAGKPTTKLIDEQADIFSFIMFNLGMEPKFGK